MKKYLTLSARTIAISYATFSLLVLACFSFALWFAWQQFVEEDWHHILHADSQRLQRVYEKQGIDALVRDINTRIGTKAGGEEDLVLLTDSSENKLAGNLPDWPSEIGHAEGSGRFVVDVDGQEIRILANHVILDSRYHLIVAHNIDKYRLLENMFLYGLCGSAIFITALGIAGGLLVRRSLLNRVNDINRAAAAIMQGDFSHRLPHHGGDDEIATLIATENRMLAQIEQLMDGVKNVSNSIAHDLRTPLAELRSRLEDVLHHRPSPEQVFIEVDGAISDVDRVINIFNALLRLAEIDSGARRSGFFMMDITAVANDVVGFYLPLAQAQDKTLTMISSTPAVILGDPVLVAQAVGNLVDNALKYSPAGTSIELSSSIRDDGSVILEVKDNGPGMPVGEIPNAARRFYRGDASRGTPGAGLGLSLVAAIAKLHDGSLELAPAHPGLRATLRFKTSVNNDT
jgi:Signal transduction histidine kinase